MAADLARVNEARLETRPYPHQRTLTLTLDPRPDPHPSPRPTPNQARLEMSAQLSRITSLGASNEVRVIAYGLYGGDARYTVGVLRNAQLAPLVYPGWKVELGLGLGLGLG